MKITLKLNQDLGAGRKAGTLINTEADEDGIPLDIFWRNRLHDSATDHCVEVVYPEAQER